MRYFIIFVIYCIIHVSNLMALTAGIAIPCYYKHFKYLPTLLESLTLQTHLPTQVIISLSQIENLEEKEIDALEKKPWPFEVKIIRRLGVYMEGPNRTLAAKRCNCDVVLCIDADDIPHPQRVEAVLQLFDAVPEAMMILCGHAYCPGESIICEPSIPIFSQQRFISTRFTLGPHTWKRLKTSDDLTCWETGIHNGAPSLRRILLEDNLHWSELKNGADLQFNTIVMRRQYPCYLIQLPLLHYYNNRSSGTDIERN